MDERNLVGIQVLFVDEGRKGLKSGDPLQLGDSPHQEPEGGILKAPFIIFLGPQFPGENLLPYNFSDEYAPPVLILLAHKGRILQVEDELNPLFKNLGNSGQVHRGSNPLLVFTEVLKITQVVKDIETLFIFSRAEQIQANPGPPSNHLPKLNLRADALKEDQVDDFWDRRSMSGRCQNR